MSCLLPLVAGVCLADPSQIEFYADASKQVSGKYNYTIRDGQRFRDFGGAHVGRVGFQVEAQLTAEIRLRYGWEHISLLDTDADRGQERFFTGFVWRPFR